ncbi:MAG: ATP-binding protein [Myxococcota bacterium]
MSRIEVAAWLAVAAILTASFWLSPGYSINSLYFGAVLVTLWAPAPRAAYRIAAAATVALVVSTVFSRSPATMDAVVFSRSATALTLWATAFMVVRTRLAGVSRAAAERALGRSQKEAQDLAFALDQGAIVARTDLDGTIGYVNDRFCEASHYTRNELIGRDHRMLSSGLHPPEFFAAMYRTLASGGIWRGEMQNRAKDGSLFWVDATIVPLLDAGGRPQQYLAIDHDITERKRTEDAAREQATLARLGQMAAVVAHEVRNPLAGIRGVLQVVGRRLPIGTKESAVIGDVVTRIDTLNDLVEDVLTFARPRAPVLAATTLAVVFERHIALLRADPRFAHVSLEVDLPDEAVRVDPELLGQAVVNLLINSAQAMDGHGEIRISGRRQCDAHEVSIADRGPGIPPDARAHLFEPFFTTKSRGTGLGLATARRILEGHGGSIDFDCPASGGTIFTLRLPAIA